MNEFYKNHKWKFEIGDLVFHETLGTGVIQQRSMMSCHVMDRPVKIIDKEVYSVMIDTSVKSIYEDNLEIASERKYKLDSTT